MLYIVPTPIGNMEDFTFRGLRILKEVNIILVENYQTSRKLLNLYNIKTPVKKYNIYNEHKLTPSIINEMKKGKKFALISNAGTPGISDPGYMIIRTCIQHFVDVECLPGATALIPALVNSGIPIDEFTFIGFLPKKKNKKKLKNLSKENRTIVLYESPHRLLKTLNNIKIFFGINRNVVLCKEMTKIFQKILRGKIENILLYYKNLNKILGEYTIIIEKDLEKN
ncbi:16S rRNA (cytidine(1402)-2'-O)-methyltransferase [Blattabacterium cuenoti]|uniref:16S rRNA (cytidine(1402)-2'-O)-methyltransferase n=1 Tax=Blattabacterium cuenoti TaxID=1653831 RepID=UPI00163BA847|nr:16S rRNA (cytidine(1402)-2'-O)-methyltransferase [Blattabacterium cuenoti]